jgi:hypothetical protein
MGSSTIPAAGGGKTRFVVTLTSGTSYTVPAGVTYVNVTLFGGGGGGTSSLGTGLGSNAGSTGGTTTFTGATSASGGAGAATYPRIAWGGGNISVAGVNAPTNSGLGGYGAGNIDYSGSTGTSISASPSQGYSGAIILSTLATTPGASITYAIGGGGAGGAAPSGGAVGGNGGSGKIDVEYWL